MDNRRDKCPHCGEEVFVKIAINEFVFPIEPQLEEAKKLVQSLPSSDTKTRLLGHINTALNNLGRTTEISWSVLKLAG
jgi:hypothetical protein